MRRRSSSTSPRRAGGPRSAIGATLLAAVVTVGLPACSRTSTGFAQLTTSGGQVQLVSAQGAAHQINSGTVLRAGDVIQVVAGQAAVQLGSGGVLQLRAGTMLSLAATSRLMAGGVLIQPAGRTVQVSAEHATLVVSSGAAQLSVGPRPADLVAKVYQATSQLDFAGSSPAPIAAPREIDVTAETQAPFQAVPLRYDAADPWDRLYLAEAVTISAQLAAAAAGFNAQVPARDGETAGFYQQLIPPLSSRADFVSAFDVVERAQPGGPAATKPGNYLIASVIALRGARGSFADRLDGEMAFHAQGAPWGFVAYDQGVTNLSGVLGDVLSAIGRATLPFTGSSSNQIAIGPPPTTAPATTPARSRRPTTVTTVPTTPTTTPAIPGRTKPTTTPTTAAPLIQLPVPVVSGPLGSILNPLLDPLIQALNNILAGKG